MQEEYSKTYAKVFRNGKLVKVLTSDIVKGDTILIQAGDKVPVDGLVFKGNVKVSQAALNGESRDESKSAADTMEEAESTDYSSAHKVFMGSVVTSGEAYMVATVIGDASELGKINKALTDETRKKSVKILPASNLKLLPAESVNLVFLQQRSQVSCRLFFLSCEQMKQSHQYLYFF